MRSCPGEEGGRRRARRSAVRAGHGDRAGEGSSSCNRPAVPTRRARTSDPAPASGSPGQSARSGTTERHPPDYSTGVAGLVRGPAGTARPLTDGIPSCGTRRQCALDRHGHRAQGDLTHPVRQRDHEPYPWFPDATDLAEAEHHPALVLVDDGDSEDGHVNTLPPSPSPGCSVAPWSAGAGDVADQGDTHGGVVDAVSSAAAVPQDLPGLVVGEGMFDASPWPVLRSSCQPGSGVPSLGRR